MPFFDYKCKKCGKEFNEYVQVTWEEVECIECKGECERADFTVPKWFGVKFIGAGFACTDNPKKDRNHRKPPYMPTAREVEIHNKHNPESPIVPSSY